MVSAVDEIPQVAKATSLDRSVFAGTLRVADAASALRFAHAMTGDAGMADGHRRARAFARDLRTVGQGQRSTNPDADVRRAVVNEVRSTWRRRGAPQSTRPAYDTSNRPRRSERIPSPTPTCCNALSTLDAPRTCAVVGAPSRRRLVGPRRGGCARHLAGMLKSYLFRGLDGYARRCATPRRRRCLSRPAGCRRAARARESGADRRRRVAGRRTARDAPSPPSSFARCRRSWRSLCSVWVSRLRLSSATVNSKAVVASPVPPLPVAV